MSGARRAAFNELKKQVDKYRGELGNIHNTIEDYQQKAEKFPRSRYIHDKMTQLKAIAGLLLQEAEDANNLIGEIEIVLDDHRKAEQKVKELFDLLEECRKHVAGAEALEKEINWSEPIFLDSELTNI